MVDATALVVTRARNERASRVLEWVRKERTLTAPVGR
jgi:hypothetical protein